MFLQAELLASQNNSQFIVLGINCNPDTDTISHEAYGQFANDMLCSSLGHEFLQQFIAGWSLVKSSYLSGVQDPSNKTVQDSRNDASGSMNNTVTQVITGARTLVTNTVARCKSSRNSHKSTQHMSFETSTSASIETTSTSISDDHRTTNSGAGDIYVLIDQVCSMYTVSNYLYSNRFNFLQEKNGGIILDVEEEDSNTSGISILMPEITAEVRFFSYIPLYCRVITFK